MIYVKEKDQYYLKSFYYHFDRLILMASLINGIQTNQNQLIQREITCFSNNYSKELVNTQRNNYL